MLLECYIYHGAHGQPQVKTSVRRLRSCSIVWSLSEVKQINVQL